jgi:hypothetical protein
MSLAVPKWMSSGVGLFYLAVLISRLVGAYRHPAA